MDSSEYSALRRIMLRQIELTDLSYKRSLYNQINWNNRLIGIKGPKGVGKTTLVLQHIKEAHENLSEVLYVSVDSLWFASNSLVDLIDYHYSHGGKYLYLDEIHKYDNWQIILKNTYDSYPDLNIVYTGSSMLHLDTAKADLSRRQRVYDLPGMSFREFLEFEGAFEMGPVELGALLENHERIASGIITKIKVLPLFEHYLEQGYYPFYREDPEDFGIRLQEVAKQVIEQDLPAILDVEYSTVQKAKKLLMILSVQVPFVPNMAELYRGMETNREQGLMILDALEKGGLLLLLKSKAKALKHMSSPDKIYLENSNLMYAFSKNVNIGSVRETFFVNQLSKGHEVNLSDKGDFRVDDKFIFEVGGARKSFEQIKDIPQSYLAIDSVELGSGNKIPLWMFGLLY